MPRPAKHEEVVYYVVTTSYDGMRQESCSPYFSSSDLAAKYLELTKEQSWPYHVHSKKLKVPFVYDSVDDAFTSTSPLAKELAALKEKYGTEFDKFISTELTKLERERKEYEGSTFS